MNRSTVEKAIERVLADLAETTWLEPQRAEAMKELSALTELLAHYPKEERREDFIGKWNLPCWCCGFRDCICSGDEQLRKLKSNARVGHVFGCECPSCFSSQYRNGCGPACTPNCAGQ